MRRAARGEATAFFERALTYEGDECLDWPFARNKAGYAVHHDGERTRIASSLVCERVNGPPPFEGAQAAHSCGRGMKGCIAPRHLSWKTCRENEADKVRHGTSNRGERCGTVKLTEEQVRSIREDTRLQRVIAEEYGLVQQTVSDIKRRKNWRWLPEA